MKLPLAHAYLLGFVFAVAFTAGLSATGASDAQTLADASVRPVDSAAASSTVTSDGRQQLTTAILAKWTKYVSERFQTDGDQWAAGMAGWLANASLDDLGRAATAKTFTDMTDALVGTRTAADAVERLGDIAQDLTFVPITPCRLLDTRVAGVGAIPPNSVKDFEVTETASYGSQGGNTSACGLSTLPVFAAAVINFTVVSPTSAGFITAYPWSAARPVAATVNYAAGDVVGNLAIVKLDQTAAQYEFSVYSFQQTHLVADIVGYFIAPEATEPACVSGTTQSFSIGAGANAVFTNPACPAGYKATTPYCSTSAVGVVSQGSGFLANDASGQTFCGWYNLGQSSQSVVGGNVCCRVPGR